MENNKQPYRSLFWPILLIGLGVLWLLGSFNLIPNLSLAMLGVLWPVILIVIGLDILFARRLPWISGLIALLVIALLVFMLIGAPALGLKITPRVVTEQFSEPIGEAQSARLDLDLVEFPSTITPLQNSTNLIDASLTHAGRVIFTTSGEKQKSVSLGYERPNLNLSLTGPMDWKIGITPDLPLDLNIDGGSGSLNANLSGLDLMNFFIDVRSGSVKLILPASQESYPSEVIGGSGSLKMDIEDGARTEMRTSPSFSIRQIAPGYSWKVFTSTWRPTLPSCVGGGAAGPVPAAVPARDAARATGSIDPEQGPFV